MNGLRICDVHTVAPTFFLRFVVFISVNRSMRQKHANCKNCLNFLNPTFKWNGWIVVYHMDFESGLHFPLLFDDDLYKHFSSANSGPVIIIYEPEVIDEIITISFAAGKWFSLNDGFHGVFLSLFVNIFENQFTFNSRQWFNNLNTKYVLFFLVLCSDCQIIIM